QLNIQRRHVPKRVAFSAVDRLIFVGLYRLVPNAIKALTIVKPDTVIRWHRAGFRSYWRWKSRNRCGRPTVLLEIRRLIRETSIANKGSRCNSSGLLGPRTRRPNGSPISPLKPVAGSKSLVT